jgi:hypothetical protein
MNPLQCRRTWDSVRTQIMDQLVRCGADVSEDKLTPDEQQLFRVDEAEPYYGPTRDAGQAVNRKLGLCAEASQQDWEAELGEPGKAALLVDALGDPSLDTETRSAITLLLLDHADHLATVGGTGAELLARVRWHLRADARVRSRMRYWWTHMDGSAAVMEALS